MLYICNVVMWLKGHFYSVFTTFIYLKTNKMKRFITVLLACTLLLCAYDVQAQSKSGKSTKTSASSKKGKGKNVPEVKPTPTEVSLPYNSNDCIFAIDLPVDVAYGPTTAPKGAGRVQDVMREKNNPNVFEYEHNTTWYKFTVPYSGNLEFTITPTNAGDDYDYLLFKYTDVYFSNRIIEGKVKPIAANLGGLDSASQAAADQAAQQAKAAAEKKPKPQTATGTQGAAQPKPKKPVNQFAAMPMGMNKEGKKLFVDEKGIDRFLKSIPVRKGEVYYIALDNKTANGGGHTIKVNIHVETIEATLAFIDPSLKKSVDVDLLILEKNTDNRAVVKNPTFKGGKVRLVPGYNYTLYAKRPGYFSIYKDFNSNIFKDDTLMRFTMNKTVRGTVFPISDIYFGDDCELLKESDTALLNYVSMFRNHNEVKFKVKAYVQSYGVDLEQDQKTTIARAQSVKDFFVKNGIPASNITVEGMTQNEIKRSATAALHKGAGFKDVKVELIINDVSAINH